jgi:hypothetical protein
VNPSKVVELTEKYVLSKSQNNQEKLDYYLNEWKYRKPNSIRELYRNLLMHAQNRQGMPNSIGDIDKLKDLLFNFDPKLVSKNYTDWQDLFIKIQNSYEPPGRMEIDNSRNLWVVYSKSILSTSKFLSRFESLTQFEEYVDQFISTNNVDLRIALPLLLSEELFGFGFALSCDFIKENVSPEFVKPDVHIKDIFIGIDICSESDTDFVVFRKIINFSKDTGKKPYWIDKLFWLVGSKTYYVNDRYSKSEKINTSKKELIELLKMSGG